jgi:lysophospholipase L1-like esterase
MKRFFVNTAVLLVSVAVMAGLFEIACRTILNTGRQYHIEMWKYAVELKRVAADPAIGHEHIPGTHARLMQNEVTINSRGLRSPEIDLAKPAGTKRILMLGDSLTFGWGVGQDETFSVLMERALNKTTFGPVQVINSGVGNYNTAMETEYFFRSGIAYDPDIVVLNYFINDAEPTPIYHDVGWIARHFYAYAVLGGAWDGAKREVLGGQDWREYYSGLYADGRPGWQAAQASIRRLAEYCHAHGIRLILADLPELHQLKNYPFTAVDDKLAKIAAAEGFEFFNLRPALENEPPDSLWVTAPDPHPNAHAHALIAAALTDYLQKPVTPTEHAPAQ